MSFNRHVNSHKQGIYCSRVSNPVPGKASAAMGARNNRYPRRRVYTLEKPAGNFDIVTS